MNKNISFKPMLFGVIFLAGFFVWSLLSVHPSFHQYLQILHMSNTTPIWTRTIEFLVCVENKRCTQDLSRSLRFSILTMNFLWVELNWGRPWVDLNYKLEDVMNL